MLCAGGWATSVLSDAKMQIAHDPIDELAVFEFALGLYQDSAGFNDAFDALFQCIPDCSLRSAS